MSDVIDIIHRLSLEVTGNDSIKAQIDLFQKSAVEIERVTKLRDKLQASVDRATDPTKQKKYADGVADLTKKINDQTSALTKQVQASNIVQRAAQQELGIIQKLKDKIDDLTHARERQTNKTGIKETTNEINRLQAELKSLTAEAKEASSNSILSTIFGVRSSGQLGSQLFRGILQSVGVGAGLSIIPSLTAHLVEYADALLHINEVQEKTREETDTLNKSLATQLDNYISLSKVLSNALGGESAAQADLDKIKAIGVVNGEVFKAQQADFLAEQELRKKQLSDLDAVTGKYTELQNIFLKFDNGGSVQGLRSSIAGLGLSQQDFDKFSKAVDDFLKKRKELPESQRKNFKLSEDDALIQQIAQQGILANAKKNEIDNADTERASKHAEEIFQLNKTLAARTEALRATNAQQQISFEQRVQDNSLSLLKASGIERSKEREKILKEQKDQADKFGEASLDVETKATILNKQGKLEEILTTSRKQFNELLLSIDREFTLKDAAILDDANTRRIAAEKKARDIVLQTRTGSITSENIINAATGLPDLNKLIKQQDLVAQAQTNALTEQRNIAIDEARKSGVAINGIEQSFADAGIALKEKQARDKFEVEAKYYTDLLGLVKTKNEQLLLELTAAGTQQSANVDKFLSGNESGGEFRSKSIRAKFRDNLTNVNAQISGNDALQNQAQSNRENIINDPSSTASDIAKVDAEVNKLIVDKQRLNETKAELISNENLRQISQAIDLYTNLTTTAVQAYDAIAEARQKDLDREINVREKRIDVALKLAERGNTVALGIEEKRLKEAQAQRRKDALETQAINAAVTGSNLIAAAAKSIAEFGVFSPAAIAAIFAAFAGAVGTALTVSKAAETTGFFKGGYTGDVGTKEVAGVVHGREFVSTAETTAKYRPYLEAMHDGTFTHMLAHNSAGAYATKNELGELKSAMYAVVDAVGSNQIKAVNILDKNGAAQMVTSYQKSERVRWRG